MGLLGCSSVDVVLLVHAMKTGFEKDATRDAAKGVGKGKSALDGQRSGRIGKHRPKAKDRANEIAARYGEELEDNETDSGPTAGD